MKNQRKIWPFNYPLAVGCENPFVNISFHSQMAAKKKLPYFLIFLGPRFIFLEKTQKNDENICRFLMLFLKNKYFSEKSLKINVKGVGVANLSLFQGHFSPN